MSVVVDASAIIALAIRRDPFHEPALHGLSGIDEDLVTSPTVLAETDFVIGRRGGRRACEAIWADFESGAYLVRWWADGLRQTLEIARSNPQLGLADASLVALADLLQTDRIFTFDEHFRDLRTPRGATLQMIP